MHIYYGELTAEQMKETGATFRKCANCEEVPLIWQQSVNDAVCESCGKWQKEILPDNLTNNEIEKFYFDLDNKEMN